MITKEEIERFLHGEDPEEHIVSIEYDYPTNSIYKIKESPDGQKSIQRDPSFTPFAWVGDLRGLNFYNNSKTDQKRAMSRYGIIIEKLRTDGNERLENGLKYLVKSIKGVRELRAFFRDGGIDIWDNAIRGKKVIWLNPVEQYLISKEKRLFKKFEDYGSITRMVFDLETTSLDPREGNIFMIGIKTNKGFHKVIECFNEEQERNGIIELFNIIDEIKPTIIGGYNSANFDWEWIFHRANVLKADLKDIIKTLNKLSPVYVREGLLKLGGEIENYNQVNMWGYSVIDIMHAVRRAQAINPDIESHGLKYITKYLRAEAPDRVYIDHNKIGPMYQKNEPYWLNIKNGQYRKIEGDKYKDLDIKFPGVYIRTTGQDIVERYLDDDLEETLIVDEQFNQASFLLGSMVPTTYERITTMGTAGLWRLIMLAWSYKNGLAIPEKELPRKFTGGLSRLVKVGYAEDILKLDFSSLYPSIGLLMRLFPDCDIMGVMELLLGYFRDQRIKYKNLKNEFKKSDPKLSKSYDNKQHPLKIFINSEFGSKSAPNIFDWGDVDLGEEITCTGRQYLRLMNRFFMKRGYVPLVMDTDGCNFSMPKDVKDRKYTGKGLNWLTEEGKEYTGYEADIAEFNDIFMRGPMGLDTDGVWRSSINLSKKNYATMDDKGEIHLTGNTIKGKRISNYIKNFIKEGITMLLNNDGHGFVEYYYEYIEKIWNKQIPLADIAQKAKVKLTPAEYEERLTQKNKAGSDMSRMAHMELIKKHDLHMKMGDVVYYVNNGTKAGDGDVKKTKDGFDLNVYLVDQNIIDNEPETLGDYNVPRAISKFNSAIKPLLVVFDDDVRNNLFVKKPEDRQLFTKEQCRLISGKPLKPEGQDDIYEDVLNIEEKELEFWAKIGKDPEHMYHLASEGWQQYI